MPTGHRWAPGAERVAGAVPVLPAVLSWGETDRLVQLTEGALVWEPRDERGREGRPVPVRAPSPQGQALLVLLLTQTARSWSLQKSPVGLIPPLGVAQCCGALPGGLPASKCFGSRMNSKKIFFLGAPPALGVRVVGEAKASEGPPKGPVAPHHPC